jgi:hypothetical protein
MDPLEITAIWHEVNIAGGCLADAVKKQQKDLKIKKARITANKAQAALRKAQQG